MKHSAVIQWRGTYATDFLSGDSLLDVIHKGVWWGEHSHQYNLKNWIDKEVYGNQMRFNFAILPTSVIPYGSKEKQIVNRKLFGEMEIVYILILRVVTRLYIFIKTKELYT